MEQRTRHELCIQLYTHLYIRLIIIGQSIQNVNQ